MRSDSEFSRREVLATISGTAAAVAFRPLWAADDIDPKVAALVAETIGIDTHNHIDVPLTEADIPGPDLDIAGDLKKSGLTAICATFAVDYQKLDKAGVAYDRFMNGLKAMDAQFARTKVKRALNLKDIQDAHKRREPVVIQAVEGAHFLEGKVERVEEAYKKGLRVLCLLHDNDAEPPLGDIYTKPARLGGLTKLGADVIKECNRLGIVVDLTHSNVETVTMALKVSKQPAIFSHTGLDSRLGNNPNFGKMMQPRLISKEHAKAIAEAGGMVGVWTKLVESPAEYVQAIKAVVDVVGIDHVCIGTDSKLTPPDNRPGKFDGKGKDGPGAPGGKKGRAGERTNDLWADQKVGFYYAVVAEMLKQGFKPEEIAKVGGGNFCRVFDACTGAKGK